MNDLIALYTHVATLGLPFAIFVAMMANQRGWWVWRRELDAVRGELDKLQAKYTVLEDKYQMLDAEKGRWADVAFLNERVARRAGRAAKQAPA